MHIHQESVSQCKNCGNQFQGSYCPDCGQPSNTHRIDFHYFAHDIPHSILHIDKGFFYTLRRLTTRPGLMLSEYVAGKRVAHFRPLAFVVIMSTICTLLSNLFRNTYMKGDLPFFAKYPSVLIFLLIPVISLVTWACFSRRRFNFWEHMLFNTYLGAYLNIFLLLLTVVKATGAYFGFDISFWISSIILMFFFMTYYGFAFGELMHDPQKLAKNILLISIMDGTIATVYFFSFVFTGITKAL